MTIIIIIIIQLSKTLSKLILHPTDLTDNRSMQACV